MAAFAAFSNRARQSRQSRQARNRATSPATRTLISAVALNRPRGKVTDAVKSTQEVIATPPTLYPHSVNLGNFGQAWSRLDVGKMLWNTLYYAFGALVFQ